ncbi:hypothetical protein F2P56_021466 [Juglans regia]|uniref:DUF7950 domain-containing protein n=2 Tax=Juglans regia TaxID=51240 RepID=A0A833X2H7_JUGRE|nr:uncharacterized protein LOC109009185 [Juglans regia]KAF5457359.1 hypothetical protein F2P56_021466 [Juglans regia]
MDGGYRWQVGINGAAGGQQDKTIINRVMLGFRPIAPKPATGGSGLLTDNKNHPFVSKRRKKRKYVRVRKNNDGRKRKKMVPEEEFIDHGLDRTVLTLQLLPERAQNKDLDAGGSLSKFDPPAHKVAVENNQDLDLQMWMNGNKWVFGSVNCGVGSDHTVVMPQIRTVAESLVTVESVTDTCMDVRELGCTDSERIKNLERDSCPGFISEGLDRVQWVNEAYKRMVSQEGDGQSRECTVRLVAKEKLPNVYPAFTGRVRLQHTWRNKKCSKVMPCDVWRMNSGGFAWRLDVEAALSLGL